jgi:DNA-binding NarL/FixJ family response regulator
VAHVDRLLPAFDDVHNPTRSPMPLNVATPPSDTLSARELEVLNFVARGLANQKIETQAGNVAVQSN